MNSSITDPPFAANRVSVSGNATAYRLFDVGYSIDLDRAGRLLGDETRGRSLPARTEARAFQIRNPPLNVALGNRDVAIGDETRTAELAAHIFDFGVCSLRLTVGAPADSSWAQYTEFGTTFDAAPDVARVFQTDVVSLVDRIAPASERPRIAPVVEDYVVFRIQRLSANGDACSASDLLGDDHLVPLLLGEQRHLSASAKRELLAHRFSYYADDLTVVTWDNALVVDPRPDDMDVEFVLEFANAQLLEFRVYDAQLDAELPKLYERIDAARRRRPRPTWRFGSVLTEVQITVADITEIVERADNAFKVTDDVYLARIYASALEIFRERSWRSGIDRKLGILRDTYAMLNAAAQASRAELLELTIVVLIVIELVLGLTRR